MHSISPPLWHSPVSRKLMPRRACSIKRVEIFISTRPPTVCALCCEKSLYSMLTFCYFLTAASTIDGGQYKSYQHMPCHNVLFTGRRCYLERLWHYFDLRDSSRSRRAFLLYGMGGAGKTQICLKFVEDSSDLRVFSTHHLLHIPADHHVQILANILG